MKRDGYSGAYAAAVTATSATIGLVIPPSIPMVVFALFTPADASKLFVAGILPGLLMGVFLLVASVVIAFEARLSRLCLGGMDPGVGCPAPQRTRIADARARGCRHGQRCRHRFPKLVLLRPPMRQSSLFSFTETAHWPSSGAHWWAQPKTVQRSLSSLPFQAPSSGYQPGAGIAGELADPDWIPVGRPHNGSFGHCHHASASRHGPRTWSRC